MHGPTDRHLLLAFDGTEPPAWLLDGIRAGAVPGVTLFRFHNIGTPPDVRCLTETLQESGPDGAPPLLVAADQEGGQLRGLGDDITPFAGNLALGAVDDVDLSERVGRALGLEAAALGVNVVYAPVCDLATRPENPALGMRSLGDDPAAVGRHAVALVRGYQHAGVAATLKHFPGKGGVAVDTHHGLGVVDSERDELERRELAPFRAALAAEPRLVMSGHHALPALTGRDDLPATLSRAVMTDLLREVLGFDGVTITDALDMKALAQGAGQIVDAVAALRAGVDLLLCTPDEEATERLANGLRLALSRGLLDGGEVARSTARVDRLRAALARTALPGLEVVGCADHLALARELAERAITLVRDDAGLLPLRPGPDELVLAIQPRPRDLTPADTTSTVAPTLAQALHRQLPRVDELVVDDSPQPAEIAAAVERARSADLVVLGTAAANLVADQAALARAVLATGTPVVTVALRTPWDLPTYPEATTHLCTYSAHEPSTAALAAALSGSIPITGRLPVRLGTGYPRGYGLHATAGAP